RLTQPFMDALAPPVVQPVAVIGTSTISVPALTDNSPSPQGTAVDPIPLLSASLAGGASSSFRVVAGADLNSTNPLALQAATASISSPDNASLTFGGYFAYVDANGRALLSPTMIRTGTGFIDVAAASDIALFDSSATPKNDPDVMVVPGVIYTAGAPSA